MRATIATAGDDVGIDSRRGWGVVAATFTSTFAAFGVAYSFGAFFGPMADEFGSERSATAFFFAITTFVYFALGVVTGRIADRIGPRPVLLFGAASMTLGLLATSQVDSLWLGYLTYGLGVGIGVACAYVPMVAAVGGWFERRRTTALGVAVAGIGIGTLVMAPLAEQLIDTNGWRHTYVVFAIGIGALLAVAAIGARRPPHAISANPVPLREAIGGQPDFWVLYSSTFFLTIALFVPFVFLGDYVDERSVDGSAGWLVGLIGLSSVAGRLGLGALASRIPALLLYRGSFLVMTSSFLLWLVAGGNYGVLFVFAIVLGVGYGGFIALAPAVAAERFGTIGLGGILGAIYTAAGLGGLVGPPLIGKIIDVAGYSPALVFAMASGLLAFAILLRLGWSTGA